MSSAESSKRTYKVRIFQQTYSVVSSASEAEFQAIADHVDQLMHTIASRSGSTDGTRAAVMAAMHLADRLRQLEKRLESLHADQRQALRHVDEQTGHLEHLLKETLELDDFAIEMTEPPSAQTTVPELAPAPTTSDTATPSAAPASPAPAARPAETTARVRNRAERTRSMPTLFGMEEPSAGGAATEE